MKLSENFTLEELTATTTGIENIPTPVEQEKLHYLARFILQPIRDEWGRIRVTSGYRCPKLNTHVGSKSTSQHPKGEAADIQFIDATSIQIVYDWIVTESSIDFGQCILEEKNGAWWIHISLPRLERENNEALVIDIDEGTRKKYDPNKGL